MAGFLALWRSAGVPRYLAVFRHFFLLSVLNHKHRKGWYFFRPREGTGLRFTGMPNPTSIAIKDWKRDRCSPLRKTNRRPSCCAFTGASQQQQPCRRHDSDHCIPAAAAAAIYSYYSQFQRHGSRCPRHDKGYARGEGGRASIGVSVGRESRAGQQRSFVRGEEGSGGSVCGQGGRATKKRIREEARGKEEVPPLSALNTPLSSVWSPPPGFSGKSQHIPSRHDGDSADWMAARELLQGAVAPPLERAFAANAPSEVVKSTYAAILQAANYASFSFRHALELEEKLAGRERKAAALREQLEEAKPSSQRRSRRQRRSRQRRGTSWRRPKATLPWRSGLGRRRPSSPRRRRRR
ncbi:uncharacterized protein [Triticum aestivum]|uniref:uncharacterized protein n=1 Tax=Triticum aestivum TaxID=4565 RepID=UPI001D02E501|nr:uncharacterized protein LOC123157615 [Triticum aestivum]